MPLQAYFRVWEEIDVGGMVEDPAKGKYVKKYYSVDSGFLPSCKYWVMSPYQVTAYAYTISVNHL